MSTYIAGKNTDRFYTIKSIYDQDSIGIQIGNDHYRLKVKELNKIIDNLIFKLKTKPDNRYKLNWLEIDQFWLDKLFKYGEEYLFNNCEFIKVENNTEIENNDESTI